MKFPFCLGLFPALLCAEEALNVTQIQVTPDSEVRLRFNDSVTGGVRYSVFKSNDMRTWGTTDVQIGSVGLGNSRHDLFTAYDNPRSFFQIKAERVQAVLRFDVAETTVGEGDGEQEVVINFVDENGLPLIYNGPVKYTWEGSTGAVADLTGEVLAGGRSVGIPLTIVDNVGTETLKQIRLSLQVDADTGYLIDPAASSSTLIIEENDNYWRGSFQTGDESIDLEIFIRKSNTAPLVFLTEGTTFVSSGFKVSPSPTFSDSEFQAEFPAVAMPVTSKNLLAEGTLATLSLTANGTGVSTQKLEGTGTLTISNPAKPHLTTEIEGSFLLIQDPPLQPQDDLELE